MGKKMGWAVGVAGAVLGIYYFYLIQLYVWVVLDAGLVILMSYAYLKKDKKNPQTENAIRLVIGFVMFLMTMFVFQGLMTTIELVTALGSLVSTYCLAQKKIRVGWLVAFFSHTLSWFLARGKAQMVLAWFQVGSALVALAGVSNIKGEETSIQEFSATLDKRLLKLEAQLEALPGQIWRQEVEDNGLCTKLVMVVSTVGLITGLFTCHAAWWWYCSLLIFVCGAAVLEEIEYRKHSRGE